MKSRVLWILILVALVLCGGSLVWGALHHRPMFGDGGMWSFELLAKKGFVYDGSFFRYANVLLQFPFLLALKIGIDPITALKIDHLTYSLHPFVGLALCGLQLGLRRRLDLMVFPIFWFAVITQNVIGAPFSIVPDVLTLSSPLFLYFSLPRLSVRWMAVVEAIFATLLVGLLAFEHEAAIFTFLTLGMMVAANYFCNRERDLFKLPVAMVFFLLANWNAERISSHARDAAIFTSNFGQGISSFQLGTFAFSALALLAMGIDTFGEIQLVRRHGKWGIGVLLLTIVGYLLAENPGVERDIFWSIFTARTFVVPVLCAWALVFYFNWKRPIAPMFLGVTFVALLASLWHDVNLNQNWLKTRAFVLEQSVGEVGCKVLGVGDFKARRPGTLDPRTVPALSAVLSMDVQGSLGRLLFVSEELQRFFPVENAVKEPCCLVANGFFVRYGDRPKILDSWALDLRPAVEATRRDPKIQSTCLLKD